MGALDTLALHGPVRPGAKAVAIAQNRINEKRFLASAGAAIAPHAFIETPADLPRAQALHLYPGILKSNYRGYDGRGQIRVDGPGNLAAGHARLGCVPCVLEQRVAFERELSVIVVRTHDGASCVYPVSENIHRDGILHPSLALAGAAKAQAIAQSIAAAAAYVGVLCVELFQVPGGSLAVNEIAPRPRRGRKMGHVTVVGATAVAALARATAIGALLDGARPRNAARRRGMASVIADTSFLAK